MTLEGTGETTWNVLKAEVFLSAFPPSNMKEHQRNILCVFLVQVFLRAINQEMRQYGIKVLVHISTLFNQISIYHHRCILALNFECEFGKIF